MRYQRRTLWIALVSAIAAAVIVTVLLIRQKGTDRQLRLRTRELSASNAELQAFAYSVSHDLQEPLRIISLYSELLERRFPPPTEEGHQHIQTLRTAARRMQGMIANLLVFSRLSRSDRPHENVAVDQIVAGAMRDLEFQIRSTNADIEIGPMPTLRAWPDRLSVLFQNLLSNALKYHRDGVTPRVKIKADKARDGWRFAVQDNGIGFKPEYAERIFGAFKRLHGQDKYGGTGLGLAIAKLVVERHGGRIWAEGRPGEGSTFYFTIPEQPGVPMNDRA
jgi:light-regulated signal transduction histidine kinase (bacteriophytochrome)